MVKLPQTWEQQIGGAIAAYLLAQVHEATQRIALCRCLIHASLELAVATFFGRNNKEERARNVSQDHWVIGRMHFFFLPAIDDNALQRCKEILARLKDACIIVPTGFEALLAEALANHLKFGFRDVKSVDAFMSWRVLFAGLDANWSREQVIGYLLARYNLCVAETGFADAIQFQLPESLIKA